VERHADARFPNHAEYLRNDSKITSAFELNPAAPGTKIPHRPRVGGRMTASYTRAAPEPIRPPLPPTAAEGGSGRQGRADIKGRASVACSRSSTDAGSVENC